MVYYGTEHALAGDGRYSDENENEANREMMPRFTLDAPIAQWITRLNRLRADNRTTLCLGGQEEIYYRPDDPVYAFSRHTPDKERELICVFNTSSTRQLRTIRFAATPFRAEGCRLTNLLDNRQALCFERDENGFAFPLSWSHWTPWFFTGLSKSDGAFFMQPSTQNLERGIDKQGDCRYNDLKIVTVTNVKEVDCDGHNHTGRGKACGRFGGDRFALP